MAGKWPTSDTPPVGEFVSRSLLIPATRDFVMAISGALLALLEPENWEQINGELTPDECANLMAVMFYEYLDSE